MTRRTRQIDALIAAGAGALSATVARTCLSGVYSDHADQYSVLQWLDIAVLAVGVATAVLVYRNLRDRQQPGA
ncbi:hypothetical protein [Kitasatospora sp. NPDC017646]|uniref:hypothetical protein n=1 Tax=Kitasatospora sp. NPDC017646 TaxID=3364024 RepID=UPI003787CA73